jgi:hypothetical protein
MASRGPVLFALSFVLVVACQAHVPPPREHRAQERVCDDAVEATIRPRIEGGFLLFERQDHSFCHPHRTFPRKVLAKLELPASPAGCPIGQAGLRVWGGREERALLPRFVSAIDSATRYETWDALLRFAGNRPAEAFVARCGASPDWLFVGDGRVVLFTNGELKPHREEEGPLIVALQKPARAAPPAPPPSGDCSERLDQGDSRWRWIGRELSDGFVGPASLRTYALMRTGDRVTVVMQERTKRPQAADWQCRQSKTLAGTIASRGNRLVLRLAEAGEPSDVHEMICTPKSVLAARAGARRRYVPTGNEECHSYRWEPPTLASQSVLSCVSPSWPEWKDGVFVSRAPGIERLTVFEDCDELAKPPLRSIPGDGSVLPGAARRR